MKIKKLGRAVVIATAAFFAIATMSGAFALPPIQDEFSQCLDNAAGGDPLNVDVAMRIKCCKQAGGAWVELYDADGNVVDAFCDGAEEVYDPEASRSIGTVDPALLDGVVSATAISVASDPTPAPAAVSDTPAGSASVERTAADEASLEPAASEPAPTPTPAPKKIKRKHHHRRHH